MIIDQLKSLAVPLAALKLDPANARQHDERNVAAIKASLEKFGQRKPVVVQKKGMMVRAGNGMVTAARELGWTKIAAVVIKEKDVNAAAFAVADNRTAELASWEKDTLATVLKALEDSNSLEAIVTGFNKDEIFTLLNPLSLDDSKEHDESDRDSVVHLECPNCGHKWPK